MHPPTLLNEILELRLRATICEPAKVAEILSEIDNRKLALQLITKLSMSRINAVIDRRYPTFVAGKAAKGELVQKNPSP